MKRKNSFFPYKIKHVKAQKELLYIGSGKIMICLFIYLLSYTGYCFMAYRHACRKKLQQLQKSASISTNSSQT